MIFFMAMVLNYIIDKRDLEEFWPFKNLQLWNQSNLNSLLM